MSRIAPGQIRTSLRACEFKWGDAETLQNVNTDFRPCGRFWKVVQDLERKVLYFRSVVFCLCL